MALEHACMLASLDLVVLALFVSVTSWAHAQWNCKLCATVHDLVSNLCLCTYAVVVAPIGNMHIQQVLSSCHHAGCIVLGHVHAYDLLVHVCEFLF